MRRRALLLAPAALAIPRHALAFPDRTITLATGYSPGGSTDVAARILADRMAAQLGSETRIVIDNRPGAAGVVATEWLKRQPADGHVLMVTETGAAAVAPNALIGGTRYDPVADFTQIGNISRPPLILITTERFPGRTPQEVLAHLRTAPPESLTYASSGVGGVLHLLPEMLAQTLGTRFVHVPYRSGAQMLQAILTGEAQFGIAALASATPLLREGKVRGIAFIGQRRFPLYPDIPTMAEIGVQGFDDGGFFMLIAPANLPPATATALNRALNATLAEPAVRERMIQAGHLPPEGANTLDSTREYMAQQVAYYRMVVERTGVRLQP